MAPSNSIDSPSLNVPTVVSSLVKVTVVATEPVEMQVRVENEFSGVNVRLAMLGTAGEKYTISQILLCICNTNGVYVYVIQRSPSNRERPVHCCT